MIKKEHQLRQSTQARPHEILKPGQSIKNGMNFFCAIPTENLLLEKNLTTMTKSTSKSDSNEFTGLRVPSIILVETVTY